MGRRQGIINFTSTYDSRTQEVARGDLWRVEASHGGSTSTSGNGNSSLFLVQLGPLLFILPVHLSKQHLLWYGYDSKNGMHSLCPAVWSKHRSHLWICNFLMDNYECFPSGLRRSSSSSGSMIQEKLSLICGCAFMSYPSAFASVSWNGNVGNSGVVFRVDAPLSNVGRPSFSIQLNSGIEF
nr:uncharacterized protein LOC112784456 [Arachis hypogaea]